MGSASISRCAIDIAGRCTPCILRTCPASPGLGDVSSSRMIRSLEFGLMFTAARYGLHIAADSPSPTPHHRRHPFPQPRVLMPQIRIGCRRGRIDVGRAAIFRQGIEPVRFADGMSGTVSSRHGRSILASTAFNKNRPNRPPEPSAGFMAMLQAHIKRAETGIGAAAIADGKTGALGGRSGRPESGASRPLPSPMRHSRARCE